MLCDLSCCSCRCFIVCVIGCALVLAAVLFQVLWVQFLPEGGPFAVATGGVKHVRFWAVGASGLTSKKGVFGAKAKLQPMLCAAAINGDLVTGTVSGELYIWSGNTVTRVSGRASDAPHVSRSAQ